jgi:integrase
MSVEQVARGDGRKVWRVRWRDEHGRNRSKTVGRKRDAEAFDAEIRRLRRLGELGIMDAGRISLAEFGQEWLVEYAVPNLEPKTLRTYESLWDRHVLPNIGGVELRQLRPAVLDRYLAQLQRDGLSPASVKKVAGMLQGVLQRAVEWERIAQNPMRVAHKPRARRRIVIRPIAPAQVEQLRQYLLADGRLRGATLVSVLAYSGLRPGEALALTWDRVGERTIAVTGASSMGRLKGTKTGAERTVRLLSPLAQDLAEWRLAQGRPDPEGIVFPGESPDGTLTEGQWNRWTQGTFRAAKLAVGLPNARAYDLRHSFVSLLIHEGQSILEVARQAGHSPQTCLRDYGHLFDEFDPAKREPAEAVIGAARKSSYLSRTFRRTRGGKKPLIERQTPTAGSPRAGTSATRPPRTAARFPPGTSGAARARCRAHSRPSPARTGSTCRA